MRQPIPLVYHTSLTSSKVLPPPSITMPAATRGSKGITAPRVPFVPAAAPEQSRPATTKKKSSAATTASKKIKSAAAKANTSKPRARKTAAAAAGDKTATGRVTKKKAAAAPKTKKTSTAAATATKKKAPKTVNQREPSLLDKVVGVKDKIVGTLEGKPGKKVCFSPPSDSYSHILLLVCFPYLYTITHLFLLCPFPLRPGGN